jgi:hypothetical protein
MTRSRRVNRDGSRQHSDESDEESEGKSPVRGRSSQMEIEVDGQSEPMVAKRAKVSA